MINYYRKTVLVRDPCQRERLFISTKTLNNAMNKKTSMPFYTYQLNLKLEMIAKQLELEPELRMLDLAHAFGFYDEFHMSKAFKKKYGVSPMQYRNLNDRSQPTDIGNKNAVLDSDSTAAIAIRG